MSYFMWHTIGDMTGNYSGLPDEEKSDLYTPTIWWNYRLRNTGTFDVQCPFYRLWPNSRFAACDPGAIYMIGQDVNDGTSFEPSSVFNGGNYRPYFVQGQVLGPGSTPLAACDMDLYLTSTAGWVSAGIT